MSKKLELVETLSELLRDDYADNNPISPIASGDDYSDWADRVRENFKELEKIILEEEKPTTDQPSAQPSANYLSPAMASFEFGVSIDEFDKLQKDGDFPPPDQYRELRSWGGSVCAKIPCWERSTLAPVFKNK